MTQPKQHPPEQGNDKKKLRAKRLARLKKAAGKPVNILKTLAGKNAGR